MERGGETDFFFDEFFIPDITTPMTNRHYLSPVPPPFSSPPPPSSPRSYFTPPPLYYASLFLFPHADRGHRDLGFPLFCPPRPTVGARAEAQKGERVREKDKSVRENALSFSVQRNYPEIQ